VVLVASPDGVLRSDVRRLLAGLDAAPISHAASDDPAAVARALHAATGQPCIAEHVTHAAGEARAVVALADARGAHVFTGSVRGAGLDDGFVPAATSSARGAGTGDAFVPAATGSARGAGTGDAFVPAGIGRSLAALGDAAYLAGPRHAPYLDAADRLRGRTYRGAFEAHVTIAPPAAGLDAFRAACERLGASCIAIELPAGDRPAQPMTGSVHRGELRAVMHDVHALARALLTDGFDVVRTKIEAQPTNLDIPESDADAAHLPHNYFEYHLQLVIPAGTDLTTLAARCAPHGARLSRNARSRRDDGTEERFATLRVRAGRATADARAAALASALASATDARITKRICEYTVYDSDLAIDRGWL
jgi:hypothetical protein